MFLKLYQILHSHNLRQSVCVLFFCLCIGVGVSVCTCVGEFMNFISFVVVLHVHLVVFFSFFAKCFIYYRFCFALF